MRVDPKHLVKCELWKGSLLDIANEAHILSLDLLVRHGNRYLNIEKLDKESPLTAAEKEFSNAIQKTIEESRDTTISPSV